MRAARSPIRGFEGAKCANRSLQRFPRKPLRNNKKSLNTGSMNPTEPLAAVSKNEPHGTGREVLRVFLRLGLTSFGGPVAHLGYFREEFVTRRRWLDDRSYADLVALC